MPSQRIFVIGATGYLGSAIAARLARAGHQVSGLVRDPASPRALALGTIGVQPVPGELADARALIAALKNSDAVVHAAMDPTGAAATDHKVLEAVRAAAEDGRVRRFLYTSGVWVQGDTHGAVVDETNALQPLRISAWRVAHEDAALDLAQHEVAVTVLRPGAVYGESRGILGGLFAEARDRGTVTMPGDGTQRWSLIHRDDVAEAYALAIEHAPGGERYLLADGSSHTVLEIAGAIARVTGATLQSMPREQVLATMGMYGEALLASTRVSAARARRELGWVPRHTSFVEGIEGIHREWMAGQGSTVA